MKTRATRFVSLALIALGVAIVVRTAAEGVGGGLGLLIGALFVGAGVLRLYLTRA